MSYDALLDKYRGKLRAISRKVAKQYSCFDEDDFFQEATIYLWNKYINGELEGNTDSYILQGCFFHLKNCFRKVKRKIDTVTVNFSDCEGPGEMYPENIMVEAKSSLDQGEADMTINDMSSGLEGREKDVFALKLDGYTTREIGSRFGVSHVMVSKIDNKIREKIKEFKVELLKC